MHEHYILNEVHEPVPVEFLTWARWFETADRVVKQEDVGNYKVSTVFLGLNHRFINDGPPLLFETMVFIDGEALDEQTRCSTWNEALEMHARMVEKMQVQVKR